MTKRKKIKKYAVLHDTKENFRFLKPFRLDTSSALISVKNGGHYIFISTIELSSSKNDRRCLSRLCSPVLPSGIIELVVSVLRNPRVVSLCRVTDEVVINQQPIKNTFNLCLSCFYKNYFVAQILLKSTIYIVLLFRL